VPAFFAVDSSDLDAAAQAALDRDVKAMVDHPELAVVIEGHCDERGTVEYNQALGDRRASAARAYMTAAGIPTSRIATLSYGKERPFDAGHDESAWSQNRRAHVVPK
jgi:peptidoglycan-associated lipoprotein